MLNMLVKYHESILLIIVAIMAYACSTTCYHDPVIGLLMKLLAFALVCAACVVTVQIMVLEDTDDWE